MKNIHVLPTDKPSRLYKFANELYLDTIPKEYYKKYNIYITSDEEIKDGDWCLDIDNEIVKYDEKKYNMLFHNVCKKTILTTDQSLDGVQAIDDEFLKWFVKNPSCEEVEVKKGFADGTAYGYNFLDYKIIIPKEEPKQETLEEVRKYAELSYYNGDEVNAFVGGAKWQAEQFLHFIKNEDHHTEGELGNSCIDVQTLVNFTKQFKKDRL